MALNHHVFCYRWQYYLTAPWAASQEIWYWVKSFFQRGWRGWADCDVWSLNCYTNRWLPDALRRLRATKHGLPMDMFDDPRYLDDYSSLSSEEARAILQRAEIRWEGILDNMIEGFEAARVLDEGDMMPDHPSYRLYTLKKRLALMLFTQHYDSLWD